MTTNNNNNGGNKFSFTSFLDNSQERYQRATGNDTRVSKPSPKQISYYNDLVKRKRVTPKDISNFSFEQLGKEIEALRELHDPASIAQLDKIHQLREEINNLGGNIKPYSKQFLQALTGGREGTASSLINTLMEMRTKLNEVAPPSDAQLNILVEWFLCPDIPFEEYEIEKKVYLDTLSSYSYGHDTPEKMEKRLWRLVTAEEFANRIKEKMTKKQASAFIDRYRGVFYDWRKTRITSQQANYIRELETRLANMYTPKQVEFGVDSEGNTFEIKTGSSHDARGEVQTSGYEPVEALQLAQMSYQEASTFIDMLKSEVADKEAYRFGDTYDDTQQHFEDKYGGYNERTNMGSTKDINDARVKEYNALNDLIFKLEAVSGWENQELHELIKESVLDGEDEKSELTYNAIKQFMESTIDFNRGEEQIRRDMGRLWTMTEESQVATQIMNQLVEELKA